MELKVTPWSKGLKLIQNTFFCKNGLGKNSVRNFIFNFLKKKTNQEIISSGDHPILNSFSLLRFGLRQRSYEEMNANGLGHAKGLECELKERLSDNYPISFKSQNVVL